MTVPLNPGDAPFDTTTIPNGWTRVLTQEEADAANLLYPVPPYGFYYTPPAPPGAGSLVKFVKLTNITTVGQQTKATVRAEDLASLPQNSIFVLWPLHGVLGIVDDVGARPVRVMQVDGNDITVNFDSSGLDVTGLELIGVAYIGP